MAAQYSMPYIVAASLVCGPQNYGAFEAEYHRDPAIIGLIDKTEAHHDPALDAHLPDNMASGVVLHLTDGSQRKAEVIEALGSPGNALTYDGVLEKARGLAQMVAPGIGIDAIADAIRGLPDAADTTGLTDLLIVPDYDAPRETAAAE